MVGSDLVTALPAQQRYVERLLGAARVPEWECEDLRQDILLQLLESASSYKGETTITAWIYVVARNVIGQWMRKRSVRRRHRDELWETAPRWAPRPDAALEFAQLLTIATRTKKGAALAARAICGYEERELADILGIPSTTVRTRWWHARRHLQEEVPCAYLQ